MSSFAGLTFSVMVFFRVFCHLHCSRFFVKDWDVSRAFFQWCLLLIEHVLESSNAFDIFAFEVTIICEKLADPSEFGVCGSPGGSMVEGSLCEGFNNTASIFVGAITCSVESEF